MSKLAQVLVVTVALALVGSMAMAQASKPTLPAAVDKAFKDTFKTGKITTFAEEKENGVTVYEIKFTVKDRQHETDIAADGTVMTKEIVVEMSKVPDAAAKAITAAAEGGTVTQVLKIETTYETKDGKVVKLDKVEKTFEAELVKGDQTAQVVVDEKGKVVEAPKWTKTKPTK
jgi:hypothetical protein